MIENLRMVIKEDSEYKLTRIGAQTFAQEIVVRSRETVLKNYVYVEAYKVIA